MAKTIDHMDFYVDVTPYQHETAGDQTFNVINVCVAYRKGQGFVAYYHPGWKTDWDGFGCLFDFSKDPLTEGFTVLVEQATKNSVKRLTVMHESLKLAKEGIRYFFDRREWQMLRWLMENTARVGYTSTIEAKVRECMEAETTGKTTETSEDNNSNNNQNNSEDEVMTNENVKVADLIGKSISNGGNAKYTINAIEGEKVSVTFQMGNSEGKPMTMGVAQVEKLLQGGWTVGDGTAQEPVAKQEQAKTEEPAAKTVTMEQPKQEEPKAEQPAKPRVTLRKKQPQAEEPETKAGRLKFVTYKNGDKEQGRIMGFSADDEAYRRGNDFHGSAYPVNGVLCLSFSKKFTSFAKEVCQALNEGKTVDDVLAMLADYDAKRAAAKAERDAKRRNHQTSAVNPQPSSGKTYTEAEVADLMRRVIAGDQEAMAIVNAMAA